MRKRIFLLTLKMLGAIFLLLLFSASCAYCEITAIWANNGQDKVTQDELRATTNSAGVHNLVWDGTSILISGAKNEVVAFNLVLESSGAETGNIRVEFNRLTGPGGFAIAARGVDSQNIENDLFNYVGRNIELFYVRYLQIKGLSLMAYESHYYDERHAPDRFQRPYGDAPCGKYYGTGTWADRPDHDKYYPEIAVPLELHTPFSIAANTNQSIWTDIFIPKNAPAGQYNGIVTIREGNSGSEVVHEIPVVLTVHDFTLPDIPTAKTMLPGGDIDRDTMMRYTGQEWLSPSSDDYKKMVAIAERHGQIAHRHKISLLKEVPGAEHCLPENMPQRAIDQLTGDLFTPERGYDGPGIGTGVNILSIGTYGSWRLYDWFDGLSNDDDKRAVMWANTDKWVEWINAQNFSTPTECFLYLIDESTDYAQTEKWAAWMDANPGPGKQLMSYATLEPTHALRQGINIDSLDVASTWTTTNVLGLWESTAESYQNNPGKRLHMYNGRRSERGSFATEDDGVALLVQSWAQFKKKIDRWFFWQSTYYNDYQSGMGQTNVFESARIFGADRTFQSEGNCQLGHYARGRTGWNYSNGDGVLFYPGTDLVFPAKESNYGVNGPFVSLRMKLWRRGIQDADYLALASAVDSNRTNEIINRTIPKVLWEIGKGEQSSESDPSWVVHPISWSTDPDVWTAARNELTDIIKEVPPQPKPTVQINQHPDQAIASGTNSIEVSAAFQNPGNETYRLTAQLMDLSNNSEVVGEGTKQNVQQSGTQVITVQIKSGTPTLEFYKIEVKCYNAANEQVAQSEVTINVANNPPTITEGPTATPAVIQDNQTCFISVVANDLDPDDQLSYQWSSSIGTIQGNTAEVTFVPPTVSTETTATVTVVISDNQGGTVTGSVPVTVQPSDSPPVEGQTPWRSNAHLYPDERIEYANANAGYEFTPTTAGYIAKVGGSFHGSTQIVLWQDVQNVNGVTTGTVMTTVSLDASDNADHEWRYVDLPEPLAVEAGKRYAITMHAALGVKLTIRRNIPREIEQDDIIIHYPIISDVKKTPTDYPEWNASYMAGEVDIMFFPDALPQRPSVAVEGQTPWASSEPSDLDARIEYANANTGYEFTPTVDGQITKVGGSFYGSTPITLWQDVQSVNGVTTGTVMTTVTLDASDNVNHEWRFVNLPEPIAVQADKRYAITMHAALGVKLSLQRNVPREIKQGDIIIHYPIISDVNKTPTDYPEWNASYMSGHVDISFVPNP